METEGTAVRRGGAQLKLWPFSLNPFITVDVEWMWLQLPAMTSAPCAAEVNGVPPGWIYYSPSEQ